MTSLYSITVPVYIKSLANLLAIMYKAKRHAKANRFEVSVLLNARLSPDMYNFTQQVQYIYFMALDAVCGLTGKKAPDFSYDETTMEELEKSVKRTVAFLRKLKPKHFEGAEKRRIPIFFGPQKTLPGIRYVELIGIPNFLFHYTMAYAILRHNGVPVGKVDFIGSLPGLGKSY